jgi:hypothetical protein
MPNHDHTAWEADRDARLESEATSEVFSEVQRAEPERGPLMVREDGPVHEWFGLSYSSYIVLHRALMQSMPIEWQERMVACVRELQEAYEHVALHSEYCVTPRKNGKYVKETLPHYRRGRVDPGGRWAREAE